MDLDQLWQLEPLATDPEFIAAFAAAARTAWMSSLGMSSETVTWLVGADHSGWRLLMFVGATPALLTFIVRIFVPESERWQHAAHMARTLNSDDSCNLKSGMTR
jgi:hypothetical protein